MKKRDKFWLDRILSSAIVVFLFISVSVYNMAKFNASYIADEIDELSIYSKQIEWTITTILKNNDTKILQQYCNDFKDDKEFNFRIFDGNKNLVASSSKDKTSKMANEDTILKKTKHNLWDLYKHSFKDKRLEQVDELNINGKKYYLEVSISEAFVIETIISAQKNITILFGICLMMLILYVIQIFCTIRSSFNGLEDSVVKISKGELDTKIKVPKNGLLEELAISIVYMTQKLKMQIERLTKLEKYKSEFIQNITHEIKTPITAINSAIELIEEQNTVDKINKECFDIIKFQTNAINKLTGDILSLSEIDLKKTGEINNFQDIDLASAIKEAVENQGITDCKINIIKNDDYIIKADRELLITAISNLLSNAIRYSKSDTIDIILSKKEDNTTIEIKDYGIGIEEEHLNRIFERFYRVDKSRSRKKGGTGLGLSIVKNIVELHKWNIEVKSAAGKGTSFIIKA